MDDSMQLIAELRQLRNKEKAKILSRFFKTGKGEYGEGDFFWGITVPEQRIIAKKFQNLSLKNISSLLNHSIHEVRLTAALVLVSKYEKEKTQTGRRIIYDFYIKKLERFNNWDLIDLSVYKILGHYLYHYNLKDAYGILQTLAKSSCLWRRRAAMVSTFYFIKQGRSQETFKLAQILKNDKHDLIHKATGWMLREVGKRVSEEKLCLYLNKNCKTMPRVSLRYALEKFPEKNRKFYLKKS